MVDVAVFDVQVETVAERDAETIVHETGTRRGADSAIVRDTAPRIRRAVSANTASLAVVSRGRTAPVTISRIRAPDASPEGAVTWWGSRWGPLWPVTGTPCLREDPPVRHGTPDPRLFRRGQHAWISTG